MAFPVDAGVAVALIHFRQALGVMETLRAEAGEAVDAILARAPVVAGVAGALIDVDVAHATWVRVQGRKRYPVGCAARYGGCLLSPRGSHQAGPPPATQGTAAGGSNLPAHVYRPRRSGAALRVG